VVRRICQTFSDIFENKNKKGGMKNEVSINSTEITFGEDERSYQELVDNISIRFVKGRAKAYYEVNKSLVYTKQNDYEEY